MGTLSEYPTPPPLRTPTYIHPLHLTVTQYFSIKLFPAASKSLCPPTSSPSLPPAVWWCGLFADIITLAQVYPPPCKCTLSQDMNKARGLSDFRCQCNVTSLHSRCTRFLLHREKKEKVKDLPWGWWIAYFVPIVKTFCLDNDNVCPYESGK